MNRPGLAVVGIAYTVTWCVGLAVFGSSTSVNSTGRHLLEQEDGHSGVLALQFLLTQGVAALLLGVVLAAWAAASTGAERSRILWAGGAAVVVSLVQCVVGLVLSLSAVPDGDPDAVGALTATLNRLDGVKMLLLAVALGTVALGRSLTRPRWLAALCAAATVTLLVSAVGYGFAAPGPAMAAYASLPLLLASISAGAFAVADRHGARRARPSHG